MKLMRISLKNSSCSETWSAKLHPDLCKLLSGRKRSLSRILRNLWVSAGRFCGRFHIAKSKSKKNSAEPQRFCRTLGAKPSLSDPANSLRAKGTLISEPRSSTPCEMRFFPSEKGKTAFSKKNPRERPFSLSRVGKIASRRG